MNKQIFFKYIAELEEQVYSNRLKQDMLSEKDEGLIQDAIERNIEEIKRGINLFTEKRDKEKNLQDLYELEYSINHLHEIIFKVKEEVELNIFFKEGKGFNIKKIDKLYKDKKIKLRFPNFNIDRWKEILINPILEVKNYNGEIIKFDSFLVRKIMIAINQMIFNEMDIYQLVCGKEGSGKSCFSSALLLYYYTILKEVGLIEYEYNITRMFFASVLSLLDEINLIKNNEFFRLMTLDEANELNRLNFKEDETKEFKQDMRTGRKLLRIMTINIQQIGELDISISLSRVNFIFDCIIDNDVETGTLKKGEIDMYIIPRGDKIHSEYHTKDFTRTEILNTFANKLEKKKDYYISLPKEFIVHKIKFNGIWGFNKLEYDEHIKNENRRRAIGREIKISDLVAYALIKKIFSIKYKEFGTFNLDKTGDKKLYDTIRKFTEKIKQYFKLNSNIEQNYDRIYEQKEEIKEQNIHIPENEDHTPEKYKEEVYYVPDVTTEKPKTFMTDLNK